MEAAGPKRPELGDETDAGRRVRDQPSVRGRQHESQIERPVSAAEHRTILQGVSTGKAQQHARVSGTRFACLWRFRPGHFPFPFVPFLCTLLLRKSTLTMARTKGTFEMKTGRTWHTEDEVRRMKDHVVRFPAARKIADEIVERAEIWAKLDDAYVRDLPPPADVFRGFLPSFDGCPVHGEAVFQTPGGPWQVDIFNRPWKIKCAVGGEEYPSNDFMAFYRTGDRALLTGDYADDGSGWDPGDGRSRFWFVAHYCYRLWHQLIPALQDLGRAYLMTGDPAVRPQGRDPAGQDGRAVSHHGPRRPVLVRLELSGGLYGPFSVRRTGIVQYRALCRGVRQPVSGVAG